VQPRSRARFFAALRMTAGGDKCAAKVQSGILRCANGRNDGVQEVFQHPARTPLTREATVGQDFATAQNLPGVFYTSLILSSCNTFLPFTEM
jgi:hypothetical protein